MCEEKCFLENVNKKAQVGRSQMLSAGIYVINNAYKAYQELKMVISNEEGHKEVRRHLTVQKIPILLIQRILHQSVLTKPRNRKFILQQ